MCGASASNGATLHVDHIIPVSRDGRTVPENLQTLCEPCNLGKSNRFVG
ncbi:HNH endonuclease [Salinibacterium sp. CAN_S4]